MLENASTFEELENDKENIENKIIKIEDLFKNNKKIVLNERKLELFLNGVMLTHILEDGLYNIYNEKEEFIGLGAVEKELLKRDIVL